MALTLTKHSIKTIDLEISAIIRKNNNRYGGIDNYKDDVFREIDELLKLILGEHDLNSKTGKIRFEYTLIYRVFTTTLVWQDSNNTLSSATITHVSLDREQEADQVIIDLLQSRLNHIKELLTKKPNKPDSAYGNVLFGTQRALFEPNTEPEDNLYDKLKGYIVDNTKFDSKVKNELLSILKSGEYTDVITPPTPGTIIYRGMSITKEDLLRLLTPEEVDDMETSRTKKSKSLETSPLVFKPKEAISSWSKDKSVAVNFSTDNVSIKKRKIYTIILSAKITGQETMSFFDVQNWYKELDGYEAEQEVIALSDVVVDEIEYGLVYPGVKLDNDEIVSAKA